MLKRRGNLPDDLHGVSLVNTDDDHFAALRHLAGQAGDVDLMRDKHHRSAETLPAEPGQRGSGAHFCGRTVAKDRIEQLKRHDVADPEQASGIEAATPLARIDGCRRDAVRTEQVADRAGLRTTLFRQIPLGAAITEPEARRIAGAWGRGMAAAAQWLLRIAGLPRVARRLGLCRRQPLRATGQEIADVQFASCFSPFRLAA